MSKQNRRSGGSFRTLGQRMLSFGRGIMRTYGDEASLQPDTAASESSPPRGQWRSKTSDNLIWRQEQPAPQATPPPAQVPTADYDGDYTNYDDMNQPIQRQPQPRPQQPQNPTPSYIKTKDGSLVRASEKQFSDPIQRRLNAIAAAHEAKNAVRDQERDQKKENIQRKVDSGEFTSTRRRRGSIDVDYVQTESLLPAEERGKQPDAPIQRQETSDSSDTGDSTEDSEPANDIQEEANWFDEVPDDDADIDSIAGFESTDDAVQRMPDDLPQFDISSLEEEDSSDSLGEFESGYDDFPSQSADQNDPINRDYDDNADFVSYSDTVDNNYPSSNVSEPSVQRLEDDYDLPQFDSSDDTGSSTDAPDITPTFNAPVQRAEANTYYTDFSNQPADVEANVDDASSTATPPTDTPLQRNTLQRAEMDEPADTDFSDYGDFDLNDMPSVESTSHDNTPIQRTEMDEPTDIDFNNDADVVDMPPVDSMSRTDTPVRRTELDEPSITYFEDTDNYPESDFDDTSDNTFSDVPSVDSTSPRNDNPVQRRAEADVDPASDFDYGDDSDYADSDFTDIPHIDSTSSNDAPVQRYADYDEPAFTDDSDDDSDNTHYDSDAFNDVTHIDSPSVNDTPVQRYADYGDEPAFTEFDDDANYDVTHIDSPSASDTPVQRYTDYDEPTFTDDDDDNDTIDYGGDTVNDVPHIESPPASDTPVQRYADYDEDTVNDVPHVDSPPASDTPVQRESIQRSEADTSAFEDIADALDNTLRDTSNGEHDISDADDTSHPMSNPMGSLSISPTTDTPAQQPVQRQTLNTPEPDVPANANPVNDTSVQRQPVEPSDLDQSDDYDDYGDQTWAEANDYSPPTNTPSAEPSIQRQEMDDFDDFDDNDFGDLPDVTRQAPASPVQRDFIQRDEIDNFDDNDFGDIPDVTSQAPTSPVQRDFIQRDELEDFDFDDNDFGDMPDATSQAPASPVQRNFIQRDEIEDVDDYVDDDFSEYLTDDTPDVQGNARESISIQPQSVQRSEMDDRTFDIIGDMDTFDIQPPPADSNPVQRVEGDEPHIKHDDFGDQTWAQANDYSPATDSNPVQRVEIDELQTELDDFGDQTWAQANDYSPATDSNPVQRVDVDEPQTEHDDFGDQTWAQANDYSPATDNAMSAESPIQREVDDTASQLPQFDEDFDHLEDTDGLTAMNILGDYLSEQPASDSTGDRAPVQRDYADESYDYLPEDFDPTPTIYNFNDAVDAGTPTDTTPVQREFDGNLIESDEPVEQPIDLFQALSQLGKVNKPSIQRDYQNNDEDGYDNFGDQTWAEFHDYSPATDHATNGDTPIQRSTNGELIDSDQPVEQPIDLFQALSQLGKANNTANDAPVQRSPDDEGADDNHEMMDLYQAMMQSGMIQDSAQTGNTSSNSEPIQRASQPDQPDMAEALMRASQVSESSSTNYTNGSNSNGSTENTTTNVISRNVIQRAEDVPVTASEYATSPEINAQEASDDTTQEDQEYLTQLARDVFRIIKRRLREEKERRG